MTNLTETIIGHINRIAKEQKERNALEERRMAEIEPGNRNAYFDALDSRNDKIKKGNDHFLSRIIIDSKNDIGDLNQDISESLNIKGRGIDTLLDYAIAAGWEKTVFALLVKGAALTKRMDFLCRYSHKCLPAYSHCTGITNNIFRGFGLAVRYIMLHKHLDVTRAIKIIAQTRIYLGDRELPAMVWARALLVGGGSDIVRRASYRSIGNLPVEAIAANLCYPFLQGNIITRYVDFGTLARIQYAMYDEKDSLLLHIKLRDDRSAAKLKP